MSDDYDDTYGEGPQEPRREIEPEPCLYSADLDADASKRSTDASLTRLSEFTATPQPLTFEEQVWACPICGWAVALCTEHRAMAEDIAAEQEADMRRDDES